MELYVIFVAGTILGVVDSEKKASEIVADHAQRGIVALCSKHQLNLVGSFHLQYTPPVFSRLERPIDRSPE